MVKDVGILRLFPGITRATVSISKSVLMQPQIYSHADKSVSPAAYARSCITVLW